MNLKYNYVNKNKEKISDIVGTHSELNAVIKLGIEDCSKLTLVNTRINRNNLLDHSAPCNGCSDMIKQLNFKNVYHTDSQADFIQYNINKN
jgi:cytidine deaminase